MTPTDEAVEAAAREMTEARIPTGMGSDQACWPPWDKLDKAGREPWLRYARAALTAAAPLMVGWRPIETAPKEEPVLLWNGDILIGFWTAQRAFTHPFNNWTTGWETVGGYDVGFNSIRTPTHWMPLPPPPEAA